MNKLRVGSKPNSALNHQWAGHLRRWGKKFTAKIRRMKDKETIIKETKEDEKFHN